MNRAKINNSNLELTFNYKFVFNRRISIEKTIDNVIVQTQPFVLRDTFIEFEYLNIDKDERDRILNLYLTDAIFTFTGYTEGDFICMVVEYEEEKKAGYYDIKGKFLILDRP